jgi:catechol 2,3-dioxygenase-like lactoylglutathione lyase family enzyme
VLSDAELVGFIPTLDLAAAKEFYGSTLGLRVLDENESAVVFDANGTRLRVVRVGTLNVMPFTVLGWRVDNIAERLAALRSVGVSAMRYDGFEQDEDGVWTAPSGSRIAWFTDADGNTLSLEQPPSS